MLQRSNNAARSASLLSGKKIFISEACFPGFPFYLNPQQNIINRINKQNIAMIDMKCFGELPDDVGLTQKT